MATAGSLRDVLGWYPPVRTDNANKQAVVTYPTAAYTTRGEVVGTEFMSGEGVQHNQQTPRQRYTVTVRSRTVVGLATDWRVVWVNRSRTLDVLAVTPHPNGGPFVVVTLSERPATTQG